MRPGEGPRYHAAVAVAFRTITNSLAAESNDGKRNRCSRE